MAFKRKHVGTVIKAEVIVFLTENKIINLSKFICDHKFEMHLAYFVDILEYFNMLTYKQGSGNNKSVRRYEYIHI